MANAVRDGADLWYELQGEGDPLTLIGGYALVHDQFEFCNEYLREKFQLVHWDYRGVGRSSWSMTEPYTVEGWVEDMRAVLDHAGIERTHIWATSTGSALGIRFASKYPERTLSLTTYPWVKADSTWKAIFNAACEVTLTFGVENMSRLYAGAVLPPDVLYSSEGIEYEKWAKERYKKNVNISTIRNVSDAYANVDLTSDVARLQCPTFLLMGNESALNEEEALEAASFETLIREFQKLKPDAEVGAVEGAGSTYCMITKPKETCEGLISFIQRLNQSS